eukprot:5652500-Amphidinium_carterae.1
MSELGGTALTLFEHVDVDKFATADGFGTLLQILDGRFATDAVHELVNAFQSLLEKTSRASGESMQSYTARFGQQVAHLAQLKVDLPQELLSWLLLKRSRLRAEQRASVLAAAPKQYGDWKGISRVLHTLFPDVGQLDGVTTSAFKPHAQTPHRFQKKPPARRVMEAEALDEDDADDCYDEDEEETSPVEDPPVAESEAEVMAAYTAARAKLDAMKHASAWL